MITFKKMQTGFTLIELMIVVAIIGILATIALPAYEDYITKTKYAEIVSSTYAVKGAVDICGQDLGTLTGCSGDVNSIGYLTYGITNIAPSENPADNVQSITVTNGIISAAAIGSSASPSKGLKGETYILKPTLNTLGQVIWTVDPNSTCKTSSPPFC